MFRNAFMERVQEAGPDPIRSQQGECYQHTNTCQQVGEFFVWFVSICDEPRTENNGSHQENKKEPFDLWQSLPGRKHAIPSP